MAEEKKIDEACGDRHVESVVRKFRERSRVGQAKYGHTLERGDLSLKDWLKHLQEEMMDAVNYVEAAQEDRNSIHTSGQFISHCHLISLEPCPLYEWSGHDLPVSVQDRHEELDCAVLMFIYHREFGLRMVGFDRGYDLEKLRVELHDITHYLEDVDVVGYIPIGLPPE